MTTGAARNMRKELNSITECPVCTDTYSNPRTLPCIHTFCLKCVKGFCKDKLPADRVACPMCRTEFTIPDNGVDGLPKNFFIEQLKNINATHSGHCEGCTKTEAGTETRRQSVKFCIECQQRFCEDCVDCHRRMRVAYGHRLVESGDDEDTSVAAGKMIPIYCDTHPDRAIELYCSDCQSAMCFMCFAEMHSGHKCSDVNKVMHEFRKQMTADTEKLTETISKCRELLNVQKRNNEEFISMADAIQREINERVEHLKNLIDAEKFRLLNELEMDKKNRTKEIQHVIGNIEHHMSSADSLVNYTEELKNKGSASSIAQQSRILHDRFEELMKLDNIQLEINDLSSSRMTFEAEKIPVKTTDSLVGQVHWQGSIPKVVQSTTTPTLTHVISDDSRQVIGVTSVDSRLFVLRDPSHQQIQVYDIRTFKQQRALEVKDLGNNTLYSGLTSCVTDNCVYVSNSDNCRRTVYKVELSGNNKVFSWRAARGSLGLSVNTACNLLVTCYGASKIQEYTTSGSLVREICLQSNDVELCPYHAIQLTSDQFVVSYRNKASDMWDVVEVDTKGLVVVSYTNQLKSTTRQTFVWPRHLSVDEDNECILVADRNNRRIVILNRSLKCCARELNVMSVEGGLQQPSCVYFNISQNRLFVGELNGRCRVLVFDNVI